MASFSAQEGEGGDRPEVPEAAIAVRGHASDAGLQSSTETAGAGEQGINPAKISGSMGREQQSDQPR